MSKFRVKYLVPNATANTMRGIAPGQTVGDVIALIARADSADIDQLSLDGCRLPHDELFDDHYESKDQLFVFSKAASASESAPPRHRLEFPPSCPKKGLLRRRCVPDGIVAHLSRRCGGNVHDRELVGITSSDPAHDDLCCAAKNAADMETDVCFISAERDCKEDIPNSRNNWICYDFRDKRIVPTHYAIRSWRVMSGGSHPKSWIVETSEDGESWKEIDRREDSDKLNDAQVVGVFEVRDARECRLIRLVNVGRNHFGNDCLHIEAWEVFGTLVE
jgi:hypothetical protein